MIDRFIHTYEIAWKFDELVSDYYLGHNVEFSYEILDSLASMINLDVESATIDVLNHKRSDKFLTLIIGQINEKIEFVNAIHLKLNNKSKDVEEIMSVAYFEIQKLVQVLVSLTSEIGSQEILVTYNVL